MEPKNIILYARALRGEVILAPSQLLKDILVDPNYLDGDAYYCTDDIGCKYSDYSVEDKFGQIWRIRHHLINSSGSDGIETYSKDPSSASLSELNYSNPEFKKLIKTLVSYILEVSDAEKTIELLSLKRCIDHSIAPDGDALIIAYDNWGNKYKIYHHKIDDVDSAQVNCFEDEFNVIPYKVELVCFK